METISATGKDIAFDERGGGDSGSAVVLIPGGGNGAEQWDGALRSGLVETGHRTIAVNVRGVPPSSPLSDGERVDDVADDVIALIEALQLDRCRLVGRSLGALVAQSTVVRRPDLIRSASLLIGGGNFAPSMADYLGLMTACIEAGGELADRAMHLATVDMIVTPDQRVDAEAYRLVSDAVASMLPPPEQRGPAIAHNALSAAWASQEHVEELRGLDVPCLFLAHEHDTLFTVAGRREAAAAVTKGEVVVVPGVNHVSVDAATYDAWAGTVVPFITRN